MFQNRVTAPYADPSFEALLMGDHMERDDDYLRELLQEMEAADEWMHASLLAISSEPDELKRHFHILLLVDAGFLAPMTEAAHTFRITNAGHDFLALSRSNVAWEVAKTAVRHLGGASVQMLYRALEGYAMHKMAEAGVLLG